METKHCLFVLFTLALCGCANAQDLPMCDNPTIWRNDNITCPARAVCSDVFDTVRNWQNGTRCLEHRVIHNCRCSNNDGIRSVCPVNNEAHMLYASRAHKQYMCEAACYFPYCGNMRDRGRIHVASITAYNSPQFRNGTYVEINCRCPRHHNPSMARGLNLAAFTVGNRWNFGSRQYERLLSCISFGLERNQADPCSYDSK